MSEFVTVGRVSEIPEGEVRTIDLDRCSIALCHVKGGGIYALDNVCSHDDGPLGAGALLEECIECPRHGALFSVKTGDPVTLPAVQKVETYEVRIQDDEIQVKIDR